MGNEAPDHVGCRRQPVLTDELQSALDTIECDRHIDQQIELAAGAQEFIDRFLGTRHIAHYRADNSILTLLEIDIVLLTVGLLVLDGGGDIRHCILDRNQGVGQIPEVVISELLRAVDAVAQQLFPGSNSLAQPVHADHVEHVRERMQLLDHARQDAGIRLPFPQVVVQLFLDPPDILADCA